MPKTALSNMSAQDFIECKAALGFNRKQFAQALGRSGPMITGYENGKPIPVSVAEKIKALLAQERERIKAQDGKLIDLTAGIGSMIVYQNTRKRVTPHQTEGRFFRRQGEQDTRTFPVYRMTRERFMVYAEALHSWMVRVRELAREHTDEARQQDYRLELADLKQMAETAPRSAPYDVCIQRNEWGVVSRALRHLAATGGEGKYQAAHALRTHWAKYRGSGYPINRSTQEGQT